MKVLDLMRPMLLPHENKVLEDCSLAYPYSSFLRSFPNLDLL